MQKKNLPHFKNLVFPILASLRKKPPADRENIQLPETLVFADIRMDEGHLNNYQAMFPKLLGNVPLSYLYTLAQRAHLCQMLDKAFPFKLPGIVHADNHMRWMHSLKAEAAFSIEQSVDFAEQTTSGNEKIMAQTDFYQDQQLCAQVSSTYFIRTQKIQKKGQKKAPVLLPENSKTIQAFDIKGNTGRQYARVSGDYNPIHLYPWSAKLFGFKRPIIHGMYLHAVVQQSLEEQFQKPVIDLKISFKKPVFIPAHIDCHIDATDAHAFYLTLQGDREVKSKGTYAFD